MKKKFAMLCTIAAVALASSACGNSSSSEADARKIAQLESQIDELEQELADATRNTDEIDEINKIAETEASPENKRNVSGNGFDRDTKSLIKDITEDPNSVYGSCGADAMYYYKNGILVICGTGTIERSTWHDFVDDTNKIIINEGITTIADEAFARESNLYTVTLPSTLTTIGNYAFRDRKHLQKINIPESVTEIGDSAFSGCYALNDETVAAIQTINKKAYEPKPIETTAAAY